MNESKGPPKKANDAWEVAVVIKGFGHRPKQELGVVQ